MLEAIEDDQRPEGFRDEEQQRALAEHLSEHALFPLRNRSVGPIGR